MRFLTILILLSAVTASAQQPRKDSLDFSSIFTKDSISTPQRERFKAAHLKKVTIWTYRKDPTSATNDTSSTIPLVLLFSETQVFDTNGFPISSRLEDMQPDSSVGETKRIYSKSGKLLKEDYTRTWPDRPFSSSRTLYTYDKHDNLIVKETEPITDNTKRAAMYTTYKYDSLNHLLYVKRTMADRTLVFNYTYDASGHRTKQVISDSGGFIYSTKDWRYDARGREILDSDARGPNQFYVTHTSYVPSGGWSKTIYTVAGKRRTHIDELYAPDSLLLQRVERDSVPELRITSTRNSYDAERRLVETQTLTFHDTANSQISPEMRQHWIDHPMRLRDTSGTQFLYASNGRLLQTSSYHNGDISRIATFGYDAHGTLISETYQSKDKIFQRITYNSFGFPLDAILPTRSPAEIRYEYEYYR